MVQKQLPHDNVNQPGNNDPVFFYPKEFYVFDNFSSFQVDYDGYLWPTSEHAYQAAIFKNTSNEVVNKIKNARSAHDAQKIALENKSLQPENWNKVEGKIMKEILRHKINQHPYVLKKLLQSGNREIIEDSWRDSNWGWGHNKTGRNKLGRIWMELRKEYKKV